MILIKILTFFKGYVTILLNGFFIERFINIGTHRNIYMWDISKREAHSAKMKVTLAGFRQLRPVARKTHTRVKILKKHGFPYIVYKYRRRHFFVAGVVACILFVSIMSQFVWSIQIIGNERISSQQIATELASLGLKKGAFKGGLDPLDLKNMALLKLDGLSWLWVDIKGTKAIVNVQEKKPAPQMVPKDTPCDIIATRDGVVKVINAKTGAAAVKAGDTVTQGQILVAGVIVSETAGTRLVHSTGEVYARTWYEQTLSLPLSKEIREPTGKKKSRHSMNFFGKNINFFINSGIGYDNYDKISNEIPIYAGTAKEESIIWNIDSYSELHVYTQPISEQEAAEEAKKQLTDAIIAMTTEGSQQMAENFVYVKNDDETITARMTMEFTEQVGVQAPLTMAP